MPCYAPINAWQNHKGQQPQFTPGKIKLQLPCRMCIGCRLEYSRQWATRCIHEASLHEVNSFVTLTYDEKKLPYGGTLVKSHFQKFMKRLRYHLGETKVRYYGCGEYGDEGRPHFHAILFGIDWKDKELWKSEEGADTYTSAALESVWGKGFCTTADVTWESAAYVSRYVLKKQTGKNAAEHYERLVEETGEIIQLQPEYSMMSLKPAIAKEWYEAHKQDCYPKDFVTNRGKKFRVPRYYDSLLEKENPGELERLKELRKQQAWKWHHETTGKRLKAREKVALARASHLKRELR